MKQECVGVSLLVQEVFGLFRRRSTKGQLVQLFPASCGRRFNAMFLREKFRDSPNQLSLQDSSHPTLEKQDPFTFGLIFRSHLILLGSCYWRLFLRPALVQL